MSIEHHPVNLDELLNTDRELTDVEKAILQTVAEREWDIILAHSRGADVSSDGGQAGTARLLERARLRQLWLDVEQCPPGEIHDRLIRFRRALDLP